MQCEVWSVKTLLRLSLKKKAACRGKDTVGTGCLRTIGHLFLGNFRRRLARVYVNDDGGENHDDKDEAMMMMVMMVMMVIVIVMLMRMMMMMVVMMMMLMMMVMMIGWG